MLKNEKSDSTVSVVIPTFNAAPWLKETIDSILTQTYPVLEILIVDDGSTDGTADIAKSYATPVIYIRQEHGGVSSARNRGIGSAKGEFIAFIDGDDYWHPQKIEAQIKLLIEDKLDWVSCETQPFDSITRSAVNGLVAPIPNGDILKPLFMNNFIGSATPVVRRSIFDQTGLFNESHDARIGEDWDLWLRIASGHPLGVVYEKLAFQRLHNTSTMSSTSMQEKVNCLTGVIERAVERDMSRLINLKSKTLAGIYHNAGVQLFKQNQYKEARAFFLSDLKHRPQRIESWIYLLMTLAGPGMFRPIINLKRFLEKQLNIFGKNKIMTENKKPEVTILIPTYNRADLILESLDSVFAQSYRDFEIVVVDDGSTDNTAEVLSPLAERGQLRYIYQKNQGASAARNRGIMEARGDLIAFLDSDDLFHPAKLELQVDYFRTHKDIGLVHSGFTKFNAVESDLGYRDTSWFSGIIYPQILLYWTTLMAMDTVLIPKKIFDSIGLFDENLIVGEDLDMWRRIARKYPFGFINKSLARVRVHEGNISGNKISAMDGFAKYLEKAFKDDPSLSPRFRQQVFSKMYSTVAYNLLGDENKQSMHAARISAKHAMKYDVLNPHGYIAFLSTLFGYGLRKALVTRWRTLRAWIMSRKLGK